MDLLVIIGGNPAYDAPADFGFADALKNTNIPLRVHLGLYQDETAELCQWHVNEAHYLEAWGDARAYDGTVSIVQPLIAPLYNGKSAHEMLATLARAAEASEPRRSPGLLEDAASGCGLRHVLAQVAATMDGLRARLCCRSRSACRPTALHTSAGDPAPDAIEINFRRDPSIYDGRFSNNGWLQELPKPMTKMTWDNPVLIGPAMAERLGLKSEDMIEIELNGKKVAAPVWIQAGHPDNSITVFLGYGRRRAGRVGTGAGFDFYPLRYSATPWIAAGVNITKTGETYKLATTQGYQTMDTPTARVPWCGPRAWTNITKSRSFAQEEDPPKDLTLYKPYPLRERAVRLGHGDRSQRLRGLQQLHRGLPVGK